MPAAWGSNTFYPGGLSVSAGKGIFSAGAPERRISRHDSPSQPKNYDGAAGRGIGAELEKQDAAIVYDGQQIILKLE